MKPTIFISHRSLDASFARGIQEFLSHAGLDCYLDALDPTLGDGSSRAGVTAAIERGLDASTHLLAIISPFSRNSQWVPYEIGVAKTQGRQIVAVVQAGVREPEYPDGVRVLRTQQAFADWVALLSGHAVNDPVTANRLESWFSSGVSARAPLYRQIIDHLQALWDPNTWLALRLEDDRYAFKGRWMGCASDQLIHILYSLLGPLVALYPRTAGLSELESSIIAMTYRSFADDELLARLAPELPYEARRCSNWKERRAVDPGRYWLQGLLPRDLDAARDELRDGSGQLVSRELAAVRYRTLYQSSDGRAQKPLGLAANALQGFTIDTRPVFARLAAVQIRTYGALLRIEQCGEASIRRPGLFDLEVGSTVQGTEQEQISLRYLRTRVLPEVAQAIGAQPGDFE